MRSWEQLLVFLIWLTITLVITFPSGLSTHISYCCGKTLAVSSTVEEISDFFGGSDAGSFARIGRDLWVKNRWIDNGKPPLWSPGIPFLYATQLRIFGPDSPAVFQMAMLNAVVWAIFCFLFSTTTYLLSGWRISLLAPALLFVVPVTSSYLLKVGVLYSGTLGISLWGIAALLLLRAAAFRSFIGGAAAGVILFLAGFFRHSFELIGQFMFLIALVLCALSAITWVLRQSRLVYGFDALFEWFAELRHQLGVVVIALCVFQVGVMSYQASILYRYGEFRWSFNDYYYSYPWMHKDEYSDQAAFVLRGGGNIACQIDPELCAKFREAREVGGKPSISAQDYKSSLIWTFITHPVGWHEKKIPLVIEYWMSRFTWGAPQPGPLLLGLFTALALLAAVALSVVAFIRYHSAALFVLVLGLVSAHYAVFMLVHLEVRYMAALQVLAPVFATLGLAILSRSPTFDPEGMPGVDDGRDVRPGSIIPR